MDNLKTYESPESVTIYLKSQDLFKPEQTFLNILRNSLPEMKMLDIGVGAGRTALHFGKLVKEYIGIDYSESLIKACNNRFSKNPEFSFIKCDVTDMHIFADNQFDLVLFSFNGIDYTSPEDRIKALKEIFRVTKPDGYFIFSSHNLQSINKIYQIEFTLSPVLLAKRILKYLLVIFYNGWLNKFKNKKIAVLNDGAHRFKLNTYYIKPSEQIRQLELCGFNYIKLFSTSDGEEILRTNIETNEDIWIYYSCRSSNPEK